MRTESAATAVGKRAKFVQLCPREGSKLRHLYDVFMEHKGVPLQINLKAEYGAAATSMVTQLQNFYGLDIFCKRGGRGVHHATYLLAGEWFGATYVDYVANRIQKAERNPGSMSN